jgi:hypothetical protein
MVLFLLYRKPSNRSSFQPKHKQQISSFKTILRTVYKFFLYLPFKCINRKTNNKTPCNRDPKISAVAPFSFFDGHPVFYYRIYKIQPLLTLQSQMNPDHIIFYSFISVLTLSLCLKVGSSSDPFFLQIFQLKFAVHFSCFSSIQPACSTIRSHFIYYLSKKVWLRIVNKDNCINA